MATKTVIREAGRFLQEATALEEGESSMNATTTAAASSILNATAAAAMTTMMPSSTGDEEDQVDIEYFYPQSWAIVQFLTGLLLGGTSLYALWFLVTLVFSKDTRGKAYNIYLVS